MSKADPFISTYIASFLIYNYSLVILVFSDLDPLLKVYYLRSTLTGSDFAIPALTTLFILLAMPWLLSWAYKLVERHRVRLENHRHLAQQDLVPYARQIADLKAQVSTEIQRTSEARELVSQKDQLIGELASKLKTAEAEMETLKSRLLDFQKKLEGRIRGVPNRNADPDLLAKLQLDKDLLLEIRDYAENKKLNHKDAVSAYRAAILVIVDYVSSQNPQSKRINDAAASLSYNVSDENFHRVNELLELIRSVPIIRNHERRLIEIAKDLNEKIRRYIT